MDSSDSSSKEQKGLLEEQELAVGQAPRWTQQLLRAFPAFRHHNYRLFFIGQGTSLIGTWMQTVALAWLVLELTNSAFWVSFVSGLSELPILLFALAAGILADRYEKRKIVLLMQVFAMILAFLLAVLTHMQFINLFLIVTTAFLLGVVHAVEMPARQSFVYEVVGRKDIASAVALNVGMFNSARVIGPVVAGVIIALFNTQIAFFINGVSFLAVIWALWKIKITRSVSETLHVHPFSQLKEGIRFSFASPVIGTLLLVVAFNSLVPWAYSSIMPVVARQVYHVGSFGFGVLMSAGGLGALVGAIAVSGLEKYLAVSKVIGGAGLLVGLSLLAFSFTQQFVFALFLLFMIGFSLLIQVSLANAAIQQSSPDHIRGRVMSVYALMFLGMMPLGAIGMGFLASAVGVQVALRIIGLVTLIGATFYWFFLKRRLNA